MSAETLRKAATLMRERAEAATPGPWSVYHAGNVHYGVALTADTFRQITHAHAQRDGYGNGSRQADAAHIASWHPAVALAVADWLDRAANDYERAINLWQFPQAFIVARAYLGETE